MGIKLSHYKATTVPVVTHTHIFKRHLFPTYSRGCAQHYKTVWYTIKTHANMFPKRKCEVPFCLRMMPIFLLVEPHSDFDFVELKY